MNIILFKNQTIYKNLFQKDKNNREINIYHFQNTSITGNNLYYPNCLLHSNNILYLPLLEKTMSLKQGTIYEKNNMIYEYKNVTKKKTISGNFFFFIYNTDNYFHFLYDSLPYLISYFELKKNISDLKLLMQYPNPQKNNHYPFVVEMLELLGITDTNIEMIDSNCKYENVFVSTSYTHDFDSNLPPKEEIYNFYQKIATNVLNVYKKPTPKKIYISRRTHLHNDFSNIGTNYTQRRKLVNEDELVDYLIKEDYAEVFTERLSTIEKIAYFANATHVVGCIGGGIANVLFSKPTTYLRAIISPTFLDVNTRFQYSLNCVDVYYDKNTSHIENTEFKKYMRVKTIDNKFIGEIIEVKEESVVIQYTDGSNTGWNSANTFLTKEIKINEVEKLDNGLNSSFKIII
jgi:capsular polysaccharide biosynthesis protein